MAKKYIRAIAASALLAAGAEHISPALADNDPPPFSERWRSPPMTPSSPPQQDTTAKSATGEKPSNMPVGIDQALYLIRTTLLTLNDANRSGNYSVLRDLAAPDFQTRNSAADLALGFADLRRRNFDLFAAAIAAPQLTSAPALDADKMLRLRGFFPTRPLQINFDLLFQNVAGQWRIFGISVATPQAISGGTPARFKQKAAPGPKQSDDSGR